jgi:hypothetical protein
MGWGSAPPDEGKSKIELDGGKDFGDGEGIGQIDGSLYSSGRWLCFISLLNKGVGVSRELVRSSETGNVSKQSEPADLGREGIEGICRKLCFHRESTNRGSDFRTN